MSSRPLSRRVLLICHVAGVLLLIELMQSLPPSSRNFRPLFHWICNVFEGTGGSFWAATALSRMVVQRS